ncbi:MFS transporter [Gorillibacterium massiliense]|uniref:MFS transporter n=1 Tax=Gorillibacterium massiliense TaxID=1280390 RepID=UPI001EE179B1|nr:MFS transporter [Gorillibacterium massiliense]
MSPEAWGNFRLDFVSTLLFSVFNIVFNQFFVPMAIRQGASDFQVGLLAAAPAIGLLFSPLWAGWSERYGPRPFFFIPTLIGRLLIVLPAIFGAPSVYVATALVFQFLMGIQSPAYASLVTRIYPGQLRGRLLGYVRVGMCLVMMPLAYGVGSWIDRAGPSPALFTAALTGALSLLIFTGIKDIDPAAEKPASPPKRSSWRDNWNLVKNNRELLIFFAATTLSGFGNILAGPLYQIIQVQRLELTNVQIGFARVAYYACLLISYFVSGWALDRFPPKRTLVYAFGVVAIVTLLYGLFPYYPTVIIGSGIQGLGDAIWDIGILTFVFKIAPGREASVFSLHLMLFGIRGTLGPLLSTSLVGHVPISSILFAASISACIGTLLFVFLSRDKRSRKIQLPMQ